MSRLGQIDSWHIYTLSANSFNWPSVCVSYCNLCTTQMEIIHVKIAINFTSIPNASAVLRYRNWMQGISNKWKTSKKYTLLFTYELSPALASEEHWIKVAIMVVFTINIQVLIITFHLEFTKTFWLIAYISHAKTYPLYIENIPCDNLKQKCQHT